MWAKAKALFMGSPVAKGTLFVPPEEVLVRRDTIDDLVAADRAHLTPGKRALFIGASMAVSANSLGGNSLFEVTQVWGQTDVYSGTRQAQKTNGAD